MTGTKESDRSEERPKAPGASILDGYVSEAEYARQRDVSVRTCQRDRALRQASPHVTLGNQVFYRVEAVRAWLLERERQADRRPIAPCSKGSH
jgi:hypothetical protein